MCYSKPLRTLPRSQHRPLVILCSRLVSLHLIFFFSLFSLLPFSDLVSLLSYLYLTVLYFPFLFSCPLLFVLLSYLSKCLSAVHFAVRLVVQWVRGLVCVCWWWWGEVRTTEKRDCQSGQEVKGNRCGWVGKDRRNQEPERARGKSPILYVIGFGRVSGPHKAIQKKRCRWK